MSHSSDMLNHTNLLYITIKGRKTGVSHTTELWFVYKDGFIYLLGTPTSQWWRNLKQNPIFQFKIGTTNYKGKAIFDNSKRDKVKEWFVKKYGASQIKQWYGEDLSEWPVIELKMMS